MSPNPLIINKILVHYQLYNKPKTLYNKILPQFLIQNSPNLQYIVCNHCIIPYTVIQYTVLPYIVILYITHSNFYYEKLTESV